MSNIVDYTESVSKEFPGCVVAQGKGKNVLILYEAYEDNAEYDYELSYRWLSTECEYPGDEAWVCPQGSMTSFWKSDDIPQLEKVLSGEASLFDAFQLF